MALRDTPIAAKDSKFAQVRTTTLADTPQLRVNIDDAELSVLGVTESDVTGALSAA